MHSYGDVQHNLGYLSQKVTYSEQSLVIYCWKNISDLILMEETFLSVVKADLCIIRIEFCIIKHNQPQSWPMDVNPIVSFWTQLEIENAETGVGLLPKRRKKKYFRKNILEKNTPVGIRQ